jgi:tetrapyrrole methylase family protein / MazG family protein
LRWIGGHVYALPSIFCQTGFHQGGYIRFMPQSREDAGQKFNELVSLMHRLRAPGGCPWDRKQTFDSIKPYTLEETYEVLDAIDGKDWAGLSEELGDLMLQPVFLAAIAEEEGLFTISDSLQAINDKLVRRHPHIFGDAQAETPEDVKARWDQIKAQEKAKAGGEPNRSILDGTPRSLPALAEALKLSAKAAEVGFEWQNADGVLDKLSEEARELNEAAQRKVASEVEHEIGDLIFTLANLARYYGVDPEQALRKTNARFRRRFAFLEREIENQGGELRETPLDRMEELWQQAKAQEQAGAGQPSGFSAAEPR